MASCTSCQKAAAMYKPYASVRVAHMAPGVDPVTVSFDQDPKVNRLPYGGVSDYSLVQQGVVKVTVTLPAVNKTVLFKSFAFAKNGVYTVVIRGLDGAGAEDSSNALTTTVYEDDITPVEAGRAHLRFIHASTNLPAVDVYINNTRVEHQVVYGMSTRYQSILADHCKPLSVRVQSSTESAVEQGADGRDQVLISQDAAEQQQEEQAVPIVFIPDTALELVPQTVSTIFLAGAFGSDHFLVNQKQDWPKEREADARAQYGGVSEATFASRQHAQNAQNAPVRATIEMVHRLGASDVIGMSIDSTVPVRELLHGERSEKVSLETGREYTIKVHVNGRVVSEEPVLIEPHKSYVLEVRRQPGGRPPHVELFAEDE